MHKYWDKQPVPRDDTTPGEIEKTRDVSKKTTKLPDEFVWSSCSLKEAHTFLKNTMLKQINSNYATLQRFLNGR